MVVLKKIIFIFLIYLHVLGHFEYGLTIFEKCLRMYFANFVATHTQKLMHGISSNLN